MRALWLTLALAVVAAAGVVTAGAGSGIGAAAAAPAGGEPAGWEFLDWANYERFAFPSTPGWRSKDGVLKAMQVRAPVPRASDPFDRQGSYILWTRECSPGRQVVQFERSVFVAGPEYELGVALGLIRGPGVSFVSAELRVNGRVVLSVGPGGGGFGLRAAGPKAFKFGDNHLEVTAVKAAGDRCNLSGAPGKETGVVFNIYGQLAADHGVNQPKTRNEYRRARAGQMTMRFAGVAQVKNFGPGGLARVPLYISIQYPTGNLFLLDAGGRPVEELAPASGIKSCRTSWPTVHEVDILCYGANVRAGGVLTQPFHFGIADVAELESSTPPVYVNWKTYGEAPPGATAKTSASVVEWACGTQATNSLCPQEAE